ncbi:uncharacterized protein LOC114680978 [Peromyscus leucopus]|uniref:uncharacterized protein LOC114680978 n=1 Tax=Peromyscus leucopus TaxID=10041 RepID=UPI0010A1AA05|nr:uncharacterized protein LOC114680978 [Peromyscus leucopus]
MRGGLLAREGRGADGPRAWLEWGVRDWRERQFLMVPSQGLAFLWFFSPNDCVFIKAAALGSASTSNSRLPGDTSMAFLWTVGPSPPLPPTRLVSARLGQLRGQVLQLNWRNPSSPAVSGDSGQDYFYQWLCPGAGCTAQEQLGAQPRSSWVHSPGAGCTAQELTFACIVGPGAPSTAAGRRNMDLLRPRVMSVPCTASG